MINVTKLLCATSEPEGPLLEGEWIGTPKNTPERRPLVIWNITRRCNLRCINCQSDPASKQYPGELDLQQLIDVVDDLADYGVPSILFSGGEPTLHPHFFDLAGYAIARGLPVTLSTNGTRIDSHAAERLKDLGITYVGISLDGIGENHDTIRGRPGVFQKAVDAFRHCRGAGQKAGLRLALTKQTVGQLPEILHFIEQEEISRICFYNQLCCGRGTDFDVVPVAEIRNAMRMIADAVLRWNRQGTSREVYTVDQPADGAFFWLIMRRRDPKRAEEIWQLLSRNASGQYTSEPGTANIDSRGDVHPDQFWQNHTLGNVKDKPFSEIWKNGLKEDLLLGVRDRLPLLQGRCSDCRFKELCGGGYRVRAFHKYGDPWAEDPGCYLRDYETTGV